MTRPLELEYAVPTRPSAADVLRTFGRYAAWSLVPVACVLSPAAWIAVTALGWVDRHFMCCRYPQVVIGSGVVVCLVGAGAMLAKALRCNGWSRAVYAVYAVACLTGVGVAFLFVRLMQM